jgi:hypothetical protein
VRALVRRVERNQEALARAMVAAFAERIPAFRDLPGEVLESQTLAAARHNLRLFIETVDTGELPRDEAFAPLREVAAQRAVEGVALDDVLAAYQLGARLGWEALRDAAEADEVDDVVAAGSLVLLYTDAASRAVSGAYLEERLHLAAAAQAAEWALVDAFLAGRPTADAAARAGRRLAAAYGVLLLQGLVPREHLRAFEAAIAALGEGEALWRLSATGANVLVPVPPEEAPGWLDGAAEILDRLSRAGGDAPLVGTVAWGEGPAGVAAAGDDAVTVLRLVVGLERPPGLYRLDDVLLEAALSGTAPGPAARLASILAPLEAGGGPELLATLDAYLAHDADRRRTAAALHVHPNTLDYRLRRIGELTGRSPLTARGLQVLGAALTVRRVGRIRSVAAR